MRSEVKDSIEFQKPREIRLERIRTIEIYYVHWCSYVAISYRFENGFEPFNECHYMNLDFLATLVKNLKEYYNRARVIVFV